MQDDNQFSIDLEALKLETESCKRSLLSKIQELTSLSPSISRLVSSFESRFFSTQEIDHHNLTEIADLLRKIKSKDTRAQLIEDDVCNYCCNSFRI